MNIFVLDRDPVKAAQMLSDKHVVKMVLESAQMLCTAHRVQTPDIEYEYQYNPSHNNHPCNIWIRESRANYFWLLEHFIALCDEFKFRRGKPHLCETKFLVNTDWIFSPPENVPDLGLTPFGLAVGDELRDEMAGKDAVDIYRTYYTIYKGHLHDYNWGREMPDWLEWNLTAGQDEGLF